jgi:hypothetical protein
MYQSWLVDFIRPHGNYREKWGKQKGFFDGRIVRKNKNLITSDD